jgi:hypothetical protein
VKCNGLILAFKEIEMKNLTALNEFIDNWKELSFNYYEELRTEQNDIYSIKDREAQKDAQYNFYDKTSKSDRLLVNNYSPKGIKEIIEKDGEARKIQFIARINKKVGDIKEANLTMGIDLSINGTVVGDKGKATVYSIIAGGYNIQKAHYRVLVKEIK